MMRPFHLIQTGIDVAPLVSQLAAHPYLWGEQKARLMPSSPHAETVDIWPRYRDLDAYTAQYGSDMSHFVDEHESVWLPPSRVLPAAVSIAEAIAGGRTLGGVLITKTPPGCNIARHVDSGWHAAAHEKVYVAVQVRSGMKFCWDTDTIKAKDGEAYSFRNDIPHSVENPTDTDRISMIICLRKEL